MHCLDSVPTIWRRHDANAEVPTANVVIVVSKISIDGLFVLRKKSGSDFTSALPNAYVTLMVRLLSKEVSNENTACCRIVWQLNTKCTHPILSLSSVRVSLSWMGSTAHLSYVSPGIRSGTSQQRS